MSEIQEGSTVARVCVYLVFEEWWESTTIHAVFSTRAFAEAFIARKPRKRAGYIVAELTVDAYAAESDTEAALSSEDATRPTGDKSGPEDGQSDTVPMKRPVMEGVDPAATDSGHVGASTYVWLIERGQAEHQEPTVWATKTGPIAWTVNAYAAIRFQTREAAQAFVAEHLTHPTRGPSARAVQHGFARPTGDKGAPRSIR